MRTYESCECSVEYPGGAFKSHRKAITDGEKAENPKNCIAIVHPNDWMTRTLFGWQCSRKRGHGKDGLYCKQHASIRGVEVPEDK